MAVIDQFSNVVADIYASATAPERWDSTIREISGALGGNGAAILNAQDEFWSIDRATLPPGASRSYAEHYIRLDPALPYVMTGPVGAIRTAAELVHPHRRSEFYTDWLRPYEMEDALYVRLTPGSVAATSTCFLVHSDNRRERFDTPERVALLGKLIVHIQQALCIQRELAEAGRRSASLDDAMEVSGNGVIVVGEDGLVINKNAVADEMLSGTDGVNVRSGRLRATALDSDRQLTRAVHLAVTDDDLEVRSGSACICTRPSGRRPYLVRVAPLVNGPTTESHSPTALVVITDPEQQAVPDAILLRQLFALTNGEAEVAMRMTLGDSPKQIAEDLFISFNTVRTHLSHIYDKTNTHRQSELVRLLLKLTS